MNIVLFLMGAKIIKKLSIGKPPRFFLSPESPKQSAHQARLRNNPKSTIHTSGAEIHRALPPPLLKIKITSFVSVLA